MRLILILVVSFITQIYCIDEYSNEWLIGIAKAEEESKALLERHGFTYINKVSDFLNNFFSGM